MEWLKNLYSWIWFHSEFWITPIDRRPWTFCMRDFFNLHPYQAWTYTLLWYVGMAVLLIHCPIAAGILIGLSAFVLAHVVWGSRWIEKEQEWPPYLGD